MRLTAKIGAAAALGALLAACGGGGGGGGTPIPSAPHTGPSTSPQQMKQNVSFTVFVPAASSSSLRTRNYLPSSTQSVSVVETDNGGSPNPPVVQNTTSGSPGCSSVSGGLSCTLTVAANIGNDVFTVTAYDQINAGGNVLSSGSVQGTVQSGVANSFPLTLSGHPATLSIVTTEAFPKVGTSTTLTIQAKDADGNTIIGAYDAPVTLSTTGSASFSNTQLFSSSASTMLTLQSSQRNPFTVSATNGSVTGNLTIAPSSNIIYYNLGSSANDVLGFHVIAGNDGYLYYTTGAQTVCNTSSGACWLAGGNVGQFNPATGAYTEFAVPSSGYAVMPYQTADGTLWLPVNLTSSTGFGTGYVGKLSGGFSASNLTLIQMPAPTGTPAPNSVSGTHPRAITQGGDGNLYMTGNADHRLYRFPTSVAQTSDVTQIIIPREPTATGLYGPMGNQAVNGQGATTGSDGNVYIANHQVFTTGVVGYSVSAGTFSNAMMPYTAYDKAGRYIVSGTDGNLYVTANGTCVTEPCGGGLAVMAPGGSLTAIALPHANSAPDDIAAGSGAVAFADLGISGFGTYDVASGQVREYPTLGYADPLSNYQGGVDPFADGITYYNGDPWFVTYGRASAGGPLQMGHAVITGAWSIWPSQNIALWGTGAPSEQPIGLMESGENGPFTLSSSNSSVAVLQAVGNSDHDYELVGNGAGTCTVTITDAHGRSESINVTVTSTTGTVQSRGRKGGSI